MRGFRGRVPGSVRCPHARLLRPACPTARPALCRSAGLHRGSTGARVNYCPRGASFPLLRPAALSGRPGTAKAGGANRSPGPEAGARRTPSPTRAGASAPHAPPDRTRRASRRRPSALPPQLSSRRGSRGPRSRPPAASTGASDLPGGGREGPRPAFGAASVESARRGCPPPGAARRPQPAHVRDRPGHRPPPRRRHTLTARRRPPEPAGSALPAGTSASAARRKGGA